MVGAGIQTVFTPYAFFLVMDHDTVFVPLFICLDRAHRCASRFFAVIAAHRKINVRSNTADHPAPFDSFFPFVGALTSSSTFATTDAFGLIMHKSQLVKVFGCIRVSLSKPGYLTR
jgi:hypothetical protein